MLLHNLVLFLVGLFCGFLLAITWEISTRKIGHFAHQGGYHFHHSLFGLIAFSFIPKYWTNTFLVLFFLGFGMGMIIQHSLKDGFVFITKDK